MFERPRALEPVGHNVGPDGTEQEGADDNDRQHCDLERFHRVPRVEAGPKGEIKGSAPGYVRGRSKLSLSSVETTKAATRSDIASGSTVRSKARPLMTPLRAAASSSAG